MNKIFKLFSLIFSYPTKEIVEEIRRLDDGILSEKSRRILEKYSIEDLQVEYTRLFINSFPKLPCPPYESYYLEGIVYGDASVEVRKIYEKHGLVYDYKSEPPDHVSVELEFLALTEDKEFLERFKKWVLKFLKCVKENSQIYGEFAKDLEKILTNL